MIVLSSWLARRKRRRASRKLMRKLVAGIERRVAFERQIWEGWIELCNTDFAALWADYAVALGKHVDLLTIAEKQQAFLNHVLSDQE